jgi:hypothetical protein
VTSSERRRGLARRAAMSLAGLTLAAVAMAGCGATPSATPTTLTAGQIPKSEVPDIGHGAQAAAGVSDTIPLAKQNPTTALFSAIGVFQSCLQGLGVTFVGVPNPKNPNSPANNPQYIKDLVTCAAKSNILNALKAAQSAQNNLTLKQIQKENKQYLAWRKCMIARGWGIPKPTPNAKGLLFSFGGTGGSTPNFKPPPGQSLFNSPDLQACANQVAATSGGG